MSRNQLRENDLPEMIIRRVRTKNGLLRKTKRETRTRIRISPQLLDKNVPWLLETLCGLKSKIFSWGSLRKSYAPGEPWAPVKNHLSRPTATSPFLWNIIFTPPELSQVLWSSSWFLWPLASFSMHNCHTLIKITLVLARILPWKMQACIKF